MDLDERVFCLTSPIEKNQVEAIGVNFLNRSDYLVGLYYAWINFPNPQNFLCEVIKYFGEAKLYTPNRNLPPGLVCKMAIDVPCYDILDEKAENYRLIKVDFLEMKASNPKPFLALHYDSKKDYWDYRIVPYLDFINPNYSYVPN